MSGQDEGAGRLAERLIEAGDAYLETYELDEAEQRYLQALRVLPKKGYEEQTAWAQAALGDCSFLKNDYKAALRLYSRVLAMEEGYAGAYALLRSGQAHYEEGNMAQAKDCLLQAYLIEGASLFEGEDRKYYELIEGEEGYLD